MILPLSVLVPAVAVLGLVLLGIWYSLYLVVFRPKFRRNREGLVLITGGASYFNTPTRSPTAEDRFQCIRPSMSLRAVPMWLAGLTSTCVVHRSDDPPPLYAQFLRVYGWHVRAMHHEVIFASATTPLC